MDKANQHKKLVVFGGGESGCGAALLGQQKGFDVFLTDKGSIRKNYRSELDLKRIRYEEGSHDMAEILGADLIVKSPGIPGVIAPLQQARAKGIRIVSEIEFASAFTEATLIGITGTNGKTTTTNLCYHILKNAGYRVNMAGNVGNSFAREVALDDGTTEYYVLEISSFQLDDVDTLKLHLSVLLNISPDHLDRYADMEAYIRAKLKITNRQDAGDHFIYNYDDETIRAYLKEIKNPVDQLPFSQKESLERGSWIEDDKINIKINDKPTQLAMEDLTIKGMHNRYNGMAAAIVAKALNVRKEVIRESLYSYKNVAHRLEFVARIKGVDYINDSKATNVNAAWYALESIESNCIWIAGGVDKGNDYNQLLPLVRDKVRAIICLGADNDKLHSFFEGEVEMIAETDNMKEAVELAYKMAGKDDNVLLAPACASFDLFENYEDRGNQFKRAVLDL